MFARQIRLCNCREQIVNPINVNYQTAVKTEKNLNIALHGVCDFMWVSPLGNNTSSNDFFHTKLVFFVVVFFSL